MPEITTARLRLRAFTLDDVPAYHAAVFSDPDVMRYLPGGEPRPLEAAEKAVQHFTASWQQHDLGLWAVIQRADDTLIGHCGLQYIPDTPYIEVGYVLAKPYWGQGLATEAARAALRFGFEQRGLDRIVAVFVPENTGSERVMIKLGMKNQGLLQAYGTDLPCYTITREAFLNNQQRGG
ncbi:MAG: GNAT family N-acetyltransferase [Chloroflexi bacterium]|nr:GNAT family N-acetyltransferase [Chloroflexota bacterium]